MPSRTYKGNAGGQEEDPHQEVFKLLCYQLPQGLPWGERQGEAPRAQVWRMNRWDSGCKQESRD